MGKSKRGAMIPRRAGGTVGAAAAALAIQQAEAVTDLVDTAEDQDAVNSGTDTDPLSVETLLQLTRSDNAGEREYGCGALAVAVEAAGAVQQVLATDGAVAHLLQLAAADPHPAVRADARAALRALLLADVNVLPVLHQAGFVPRLLQPVLAAAPALLITVPAADPLIDMDPVDIWVLEQVALEHILVMLCTVCENSPEAVEQLTSSNELLSIVACITQPNLAGLPPRQASLALSAAQCLAVIADDNPVFAQVLQSHPEIVHEFTVILQTPPMATSNQYLLQSLLAVTLHPYAVFTKDATLLLVLLQSIVATLDVEAAVLLQQSLLACATATTDLDSPKAQLEKVIDLIRAQQTYVELLSNVMFDDVTVTEEDEWEEVGEGNTAKTVQQSETSTQASETLCAVLQNDTQLQQRLLLQLGLKMSPLSEEGTAIAVQHVWAQRSFAEYTKLQIRSLFAFSAFISALSAVNTTQWPIDLSLCWQTVFQLGTRTFAVTDEYYEAITASLLAIAQAAPIPVDAQHVSTIGALAASQVGESVRINACTLLGRIGQRQDVFDALRDLITDALLQCAGQVTAAPLLSSHALDALIEVYSRDDISNERPVLQSMAAILPSFKQELQRLRAQKLAQTKDVRVHMADVVTNLAAFLKYKKL